MLTSGMRFGCGQSKCCDRPVHHKTPQRGDHNFYVARAVEALVIQEGRDLDGLDKSVGMYFKAAVEALVIQEGRDLDGLDKGNMEVEK